MVSNNVEGFDVFLSYQWDIKDSVKMLYTQLTKTHGLRCWMDDFEMGSGSLNESKFIYFECEGLLLTYIFDIDFLTQLGIINGITNSSVVLCCITKKYTESKNCVREITFADQSSKPLEILMFERLKVNEIGEIGFIIAPIIRHNLYKIPQIFNEWTGTEFDAILMSVKRRLRPPTGSVASRPSSSVVSNASRPSSSVASKASRPSSSVAFNESRPKVVTQKWREAEGNFSHKISLI
jgi:hypothetical protein